MGYNMGYASAAIDLWDAGQRKAAAWLVLHPDVSWAQLRRDMEPDSRRLLEPILKYAEKMQAKAAVKLSQSDSAQQDAA